jgi:hypothetical protein
MALRRSAIGADKRALYVAEAKFQTMVEELAAYLGWTTFHVTLPHRSPAGFPDLVLFRERTVWAELKVRRPRDGRMGKLSPSQIEYAHTIQRAGGEYHSFLFPDDWLEVVHVLTERRPASGSTSLATADSYTSGSDDSSSDRDTYSPANKDGLAGNE